MTTKNIVTMEIDELRRFVRALELADSLMDKVMDRLPSNHALYGDLATVGNMVRAAHRRLEAKYDRHS